MKKHTARGFMMMLVLACAVPAFAQTDTTAKGGNQEGQYSEEKLNLIEVNLVRDLESPSVGISIGGAQAVRELKAKAPHYSYSKVIIPLMRIVKDERTDRAARILAALALHDLDDARGNFAIAREAEMSSDELFKTLCSNLTKVRKLKDKK